ncbi:ABC transporter permease [Streptomyces sp. CBMA29]|uniref:ABC transporter permease n=1 Tax=Streptomyces sp. CBMA29 TaxID=1896314 RepID=UPI0016619607|nr:ABC transporter permease [Streptomyces sp. CBMA29]MBD0739354.1 hypothetical protein [Streptomyces sp. CBMA29]
MNFVKRAAFSLVARAGKAALLLGVFGVICTLLLGGFLLRGATERREAETQRRVGVDVTVRGDRLTSAVVRRLGTYPLVERYNELLRTVTVPPPGLAAVVPDGVPDGTPVGGGTDGLTLNGVRASETLLDFATGRVRVVAGRGITVADARRKVILLERRLAAKHGITVGDTVELGGAGGRREPFEVVGLYRDTRQDPPQWVSAADLGANQVYVPVAAVTALGLGAKPTEAVFTIGSPDRAERLHAEAVRLLGPKGFRFDVNDKAYRDQVLPLRRVAAFAGALVWLIALCGAAILGLVVLLTVKERRAELGMLLALGERKWKLIGQHTVEVTVLLLPALGVAALAGQSLAHRAGETLLAREQYGGAASDKGGTPAAPADTLAAPDIRMSAGDLGKVAGIGLGIALVSTVLPGVGILRLHPRSILTDTE